jgi:molybdopterin converting factor small subunit
MKIRVVGYSKFKALMDRKHPVILEIENGTILDALQVLSKQYGEEFDRLVFDSTTKEVKRSNQIFLNGQSYFNLRDRLESQLKDGDEIAFMPALVGG